MHGTYHMERREDLELREDALDFEGRIRIRSRLEQQLGDLVVSPVGTRMQGRGLEMKSLEIDGSAFGVDVGTTLDQLLGDVRVALLRSCGGMRSRKKKRGHT